VVLIRRKFNHERTRFDHPDTGFRSKWSGERNSKIAVVQYYRYANRNIRGIYHDLIFSSNNSTSL
jgi:hypothetical protein